ncbi:MAG: hypothetical protein Q9M28_11975 [Mariprofundaceae bacterium]|nr:hypothetical protein [Mariprofundaceae bacterium]
MLRIIFLCLMASFIFFAPFAASAASVEERSKEIYAQVKGNNSYHAHLARKLANVAVNEIGQHDVMAARQFMTMAEESAAKAGGQ